MAKILCRTKGNGSPKGKPRVYFTSHPADFTGCFDKICEDIFKTHDCAVYYTEDMAEEIPSEDMQTDLESNNLLVVPVTARLLTEPNRAMGRDVFYAIQKHIPVLPVMMEPGLDNLYSQPDKFGKIQYLNPGSGDETEISYSEKLKNYLESVLISNETAGRIREAFDSYVFLSYRKKDRRYANALMKLIHSVPEYQDIAIWYDEFLTPGESFAENIRKAMDKSKLFLLAVTPNLLEEPEGKPNFVMAVEYPEAVKAGITVVPVMLEDTDPIQLREKYPGIGHCVNLYRDNDLREYFLPALNAVAGNQQQKNAEHYYLIGLAYLDGIDVEVNREQGIRLITAAAKHNHLEAMRKLYHIYSTGQGAALDYREAHRWAEMIAAKYMHEYGEAHEDTLLALTDLACSLANLGEDIKALELQEYILMLSKKSHTDRKIGHLIFVSNLAGSYFRMGNYGKAKEYWSSIYKELSSYYPETHPMVMQVLGNLAAACGELGEHQQALTLYTRLSELRCRELGTEHLDTVIAFQNLAVAYAKQENYEKAVELLEPVCARLELLLGVEHPQTCGARKSLQISREHLRCGKDTNHKNQQVHIQELQRQMERYRSVDNLPKALEVSEKLYACLLAQYGKDHPDCLAVLRNQVEIYCDLGQQEKAMETAEKLYANLSRISGKDCPETIAAGKKLIQLYKKLGYAEKAAAIQKETARVSVFSRLFRRK